MGFIFYMKEANFLLKIYPVLTPHLHHTYTKLKIFLKEYVKKSEKIDRKGHI